MNACAVAVAIVTGALAAGAVGPVAARAVLPAAARAVGPLEGRATTARATGPLSTSSARVLGTVRDAETGTPLPGAHVFVAGSLRGTATDAAGRFELGHIAAGNHRFVGSMLGYESARVDTLVLDEALELNLRLKPVVLEIGSLEVSARADARWQKNLRRFEREFLGQSSLALECSIVNAQVIDFDAAWWGRLRARAAGPLVISNPALGYEVRYHLKDFDYTPSVLRYDGDPVFHDLAGEGLVPKPQLQAREAAFRGSLRHFMLSLLADSTESEGFHLFRRPHLDNPQRTTLRFPAVPSRLLRDRDSLGATLQFAGFVEIIYSEELESEAFLSDQGLIRRPEPQKSWIKLSNGPTRIDHLGELVDPYGVTVYGYLAFDRVCDELPKEYRPPGVFLNSISR